MRYFTVILAVFLLVSSAGAENQLEKYMKELSEMPFDNVSEKDLKAAKDAFDNHTSKALPLMEKYFTSMEVSGDNITFKKTVGADNKSAFSPPVSDRLYIFMSSSVPKGVWRLYGEQVKQTRNAVFVLRGCVGGCESFAPTMKFIKSVNDNNNASVHIDPLLFALYGIKDVPAFVYAVNVPVLAVGSEGNISLLPGNKTPEHKKSIGDWSFDYHMEKLGLK
jgi:type-F conjugative transfer system pilin assembly protein TrbC